MSLAQIQEAPDRSVILLVGPSGAGKSAFCQQMVLRAIAAERPVVLVTTEQSPSRLLALFQEKGMGDRLAGSQGRSAEQEVGNDAGSCSG